MNKTNLCCLILAIGMIACNKSNETTDRSIKELDNYIDSVETNSANYEDAAYWENVERNYEEKRQQVDANVSQMNEKQKEDYAKLQKDYADLKQKYLAEKEKKQTVVLVTDDHRKTLRASLFGEGVIGADMSFGFMTATNARQVYENFVNTVDANADAYSREDWDEIKVLYEAMDSRKNEIEKELKGEDNRKIAGLKMKFSRLKASNRAPSKIDENSDKKEATSTN